MAKSKDYNGDLEPTPLCCSTRLVLSIVSFMGFINFYALRVNLSVAMVCMVNHTYVASLHDDDDSSNIATNTSNDSLAGLTSTDEESGCGRDADISTSLEDGEFSWSKETQGLILSSFFWGYLVTQIPGGWLASRIGGKRVISYSMGACSVLTMFMPIVARADFRFLIALRILAGMCQGGVMPAMQALWARWAPPLEVGKLARFSYAGAQIGIALTFPIAGSLCEYGFDGGWPVTFYLLGSYGMVLYVLWALLVFDSPAVHPRITPEERLYIESSLRGRTAASSDVDTVDVVRRQRIPWAKIITSKPVWALVITQTCANWGTYTFLTNIPTYLKEVLKFNIKKNGLLSSLPYIGFWLVINASGQIFEFLQSKGRLSTTAARKISNTIGEMGPALFVVGLGFMDCQDPVLAMVLLVMGVSLIGFQYGSGFIVNAGDIAPQYAGIIFGVFNTFATIPGPLAPITIGVITREQTQEQWRTVFFICAGIYTFGTLVFVLFGSGQLQPWARLDHTLDADVPAPLLDNHDGTSFKSQQNKCKDGETTTFSDGSNREMTSDL